MINATTAGYFEKALDNARTKLSCMTNRDEELEKNLDVFAGEKKEYAQFCINKMRGSRGLHGSSMSEQNHSSALCHLNDGQVKEKIQRGCNDTA